MYGCIRACQVAQSTTGLRDAFNEFPDFCTGI